VPVVDKIKLIAPSFEDLENLADYIELAEQQVSTNMCNRELAVAYLTAHIIELANRGGTGGVISSESEGQLTRSYDTGTGSDSLLSVTSYGQEYLRILRNCGKRYAVRTMK